MRPKEFEAWVAEYWRRMAHLEGWNSEALQIEHGAVVQLPEGRFHIDVLARYRVLGLDHLILGECKTSETRKVRRDAVLVLEGKVARLKAQRGVVFSTTGFTRGAISYAAEHKIGLVDCSSPDEPVTIVGGDPSEPADDVPSSTIVSPFSSDWTFYWEGQSFCAEHLYAAQILFRAPSELGPPPTFWVPGMLGD